MQFVYRFINSNGTIIYVGKTSQPLHQRFATHSHLPDECYRQVRRIEYIECANAAETSIKEVYYINLYKNNVPYFNVLDVREPVRGIELHDAWMEYSGPLPAFFCNSVNFHPNEHGDGSEGQHRSLKIDYLDEDEADLMLRYYINKLSSIPKRLWKKRVIALRNLILFELGINTPFRTADLVTLKFEDVFNGDGSVKSLPYQLVRGYKDEIVCIRMPEHIRGLLRIYKQSFEQLPDWDSDGVLFRSRNGDGAISINGSWRVFSDAARALNLEKNVGSQTPRKTYFMHVFETEPNKIAALLFLDRISGGKRLYNVAMYLNLPEAEPDYEHFFSEGFVMGWVDVDEIADRIGLE